MTGEDRDPLELLTPFERLSYRVVRARVRHGRYAAAAWNHTFMRAVLWATGRRRVRVAGLEHLQRFGPRDSLLLVANHRSFFDFFVVTGVCFWHTRLTRQMLFPVRSEFFYDHPVGLLLNGAMSGFAMYPPILRDGARARFNRFSVAQCVEELRRAPTIVGVHPEGRRNKGADPYALMPARPGAGRIAIEAGVPVIPLFVLGIGDRLDRELVYNWTRKDARPIDVLIGPEVDVSDLRRPDAGPDEHRAASDRALAAVARLADEHRRTYGARR